MRVLSPVGRPVVHTAMGAWQSEVVFEPGDLPLVLLTLGLLAGAFAAGRATAAK